MLKDGDKWVLDAAGKANLLKRTFASKCILQLIELNEYSAMDAPLLTGGFLRIRCRDVLRVFRNLKEDSATGPNLLAACVLKACAEYLALPLALLARRIPICISAQKRCSGCSTSVRLFQAFIIRRTASKYV